MNMKNFHTFSKSLLLVSVLALGLFFIYGCDTVQDVILTEPTGETDAAPLRVTMIYPSDCVGSADYCDGFHNGVNAAEAAYGIQLTEIIGIEHDPAMSETIVREVFYTRGKSGEHEIGTRLTEIINTAPDPVVSERLIRKAAENSDLVLTAGYQMREPLTRVVPDFPNVKFAIFDVMPEIPNVATINYKANEGSFLVGAIAALKTETEKIGYIGGADVPLLREFEAGYVAGIRTLNPAAEIIVEYISEDASGFSQPEKANALALAQYQRGVDVIYAAAGGSGQGVLEAAQATGKYIIWVDSNGNHLAPGTVLTSMVKELSTSTQLVIQETLAGEFIAGVRYLGLEDGGVSYALDEHNRPLLSEDIIATLETLKSKIIAGEIVVPNTVPLPRE